MQDKFVAVIWLLSLFGSVLFPLLVVFLIYSDGVYQNSWEKSMDNLKGKEMVFNPLPALGYSILCWSVLYITW